MSILRLLASLIALLVISIPICISSEINLIYDANGNLVSDDTHNRTYNGLNQLTEIRDATNGNLIQSFVHDPIEERIIKKTEYHPNQSIKETVYYFEKDYIRIVNSSGTHDIEIITLAGHQIAEYDHTSETTEYKCTDHLGSITQTMLGDSFNPANISNGSLIFKDSSGTITAVFESTGDIWTKGGITQNTNPSRTANDEWIYRANDQDKVILDMDTGSLHLKASLVQTSSITEDTNQDELILKDSSGTIVLLINESGHLLYTGDILTGSIQNIEYEPYGAVSSTDSSRSTYEGKELSDSGYDFHFRSYNPEIGLFTQPDTILPEFYDSQRLNRYAFKSNNPINRIDPTGHQWNFINHLKKKFDRLGDSLSKSYHNIRDDINKKWKSQKGHKVAENLYEVSGAKEVATLVSYGHKELTTQMMGEYSPYSPEIMSAYRGEAVESGSLFTLGFVTGGIGDDALRAAKVGIKKEKGAAIVKYKDLFDETVVRGDYHDTIIPSVDRYGNVYKINVHGTVQKAGDSANVQLYSTDVVMNDNADIYLKEIK